MLSRLTVSRMPGVSTGAGLALSLLVLDAANSGGVLPPLHVRIGIDVFA